MSEADVRQELAELKEQLERIGKIAEATLEQATRTNGRVTHLEDDWFGPADERLARTESGWRSRVKQMYGESKDRAAVMRAVKWLAGFVGAQTLVTAAYVFAQIVGSGVP